MRSVRSTELKKKRKYAVAPPPPLPPEPLLRDSNLLRLTVSRSIFSQNHNETSAKSITKRGFALPGNFPNIRGSRWNTG